jgi:hypothetical protein
VRLLRRLAGVDLLPEVAAAQGPGELGPRLCESLFWRRLEGPLPPRRAAKLERNLSPVLLADRPRDAARFARTKAAIVWRRNLAKLR